jgi:hypothetical protein
MPGSKSQCKNVNGKMVCGMLHGGGRAHKTGVFRLAKGERVLTPAQMKYFGKSKRKTKSPHKKKKCTCKH